LPPKMPNGKVKCQIKTKAQILKFFLFNFDIWISINLEFL
jgi:hypothetical protein